jgi:hypothetical protein
MLREPKILPPPPAPARRQLAQNRSRSLTPDADTAPADKLFVTVENASEPTADKPTCHLGAGATV